MPERLDFTKSELMRLPSAPAGSRATYHDDRIPGLQLRVTASGAKTFSLFRRVKGGSPERVTLGRFPRMSVEQARKRASELNMVFESGANPAAVKRANRAELVFGELFAEYLERHAKTHKRTWREDEAKYKRYLEKPLAAKKLSGIVRSDIASIHSAITRKGYSVTANRVLALVSSVFGWALSAGLWEANPTKAIKKNPERSRDRFLQPSEIPRFYAALAEEPNTTLRDFFHMALLTGARRANVLAMKWNQIDFERAEWRIPRTKNNDPQTIPLMAESVVILRATRNNGSPYVFPGHGASGHLIEPKGGWRRIFDRDELKQLATIFRNAGKEFVRLEDETLAQALLRARTTAKTLKLDTSSARMIDVRIHDLRRTLGSWQARTGASLSIIGKSLNHRSVQTTAIYSRLDTDPVRESVERATSAILSAAGAKPKATVKQLGRRRGRR